MKEFIVKETEGYRLRVSKRACLRPEGLYSLDFVGEQLKDGKVTTSSTYNFFLEKEELQKLVEGLSQ